MAELQTRIRDAATAKANTGRASSRDLSRVAVIIPARNEAENLAVLLPQLNSLSPGAMIVCDNGSTDDTREVAEAHGAQWAFEPKRGYGAACYAGMRRLGPTSDIVVFMDADLSSDPDAISHLVEPIAADACDLVIGARAPDLREPGSMSRPQRFANWFFPVLIKLGWGFAYTDLGPFRAIRRSSLEAIDMRDRAFGWTIEMQIRAVELNLRIREIPVSTRCRTRGRGEISGTARGVLTAAYWITKTCWSLWRSKRRRARRR